MSDRTVNYDALIARENEARAHQTDRISPDPDQTDRDERLDA